MFYYYNRPVPSPKLVTIRSYYSFIHPFRPFLQRPFKSSTTQRRSLLQHGYCIGVSRRRAQATAGKELSQGPYVTARAGVEPTTLRLKEIDSTKAPSRPTDVTPCVAALLLNSTPVIACYHPFKLYL